MNNQKLTSFLIIMMLATTILACRPQQKPVEVAKLSRIHFDFDSAVVRPDMVPLLDSNIRYTQAHPGAQIVLEGHCDERGTNEYNLALGDQRAAAAKAYLVRMGAPEANLRTVSYGEEQPIDPSHNEAAWYLNRRVEFKRQ